MEIIFAFIGGTITALGLLFAIVSHMDYKRDKKFRELHDMVRNLGGNVLL